MIFEIYKDKKQLWRWRAKAENGRIIADSSQGYKRKQNLEKSLKIIQDKTLHAPWIYNA